MYKPELEEVLTRHLGGVTAPEELWERIENPPARVPRPSPRTRMSVPLAIAAMVLIAAAVFHTRTETRVVEYRLPAHNLTLRVSKTAQPAEALNTACILCHAGV